MESHALRVQRNSYETMLLHRLYFLILSAVIVTLPDRAYSCRKAGEKSAQFVDQQNRRCVDAVK